MMNSVESIAPSALASALFTPVQQRVLAVLFGQPDRRFQSAELIRLAGSGTGATHRLLLRLAECGLLDVTFEGRQKYYQANPQSPVFDELVGLIQKTVGLVRPIEEALAPLADRIRAAFVYGSVASGADRAESDIDLMVVSDDLDYEVLFEAVLAAEKRLQRSVNPTLMGLADWKRKAARKETFAERIASKPRLFVIGAEGDLG
jgi:predicted nucleotidyltransferase